MIIVHDTFICKPGNASKAAKLFKEMMGDNKEFVRVMTDVTGQYHRVIMVSQYEDLAAWEKAQERYMNQSKEMSAEGGSASGEKKEMEKMKDFQQMYTGGCREIFKVW
jgi:hypothetical protein